MLPNFAEMQFNLQQSIPKKSLPEIDSNSGAARFGARTGEQRRTQNCKHKIAKIKIRDLVHSAQRRQGQSSPARWRRIQSSRCRMNGRRRELRCVALELFSPEARAELGKGRGGCVWRREMATSCTPRNSGFAKPGARRRLFSIPRTRNEMRWGRCSRFGR